MEKIEKAKEYATEMLIRGSLIESFNNLLTALFSLSSKNDRGSLKEILLDSIDREEKAQNILDEAREKMNTADETNFEKIKEEALKKFKEL